MRKIILDFRERFGYNLIRKISLIQNTKEREFPMKNTKLLSVLLCVLLLFNAALPALAADRQEVEPTWQDTIESVTPVGDEPYVKLKLTPEGYKITECRLPQRYDIVFKDGTSASVQIGEDPSHFVPLILYENYVDVETPEGTIMLYARVSVSQTDPKAAYFSVGQYILQGTVGEDGLPAAGSEVYMFAISGESFEAEVDEGNIITRILHLCYSAWQKIESWFVYHFGKLFNR